MQIFLKNLDGKTITLKLKPNDTIGDVKAKVHAHPAVQKELKKFVDEITAPELRLIFKGKQLEDGTLADHNITKEDTLHLVLRLKSGGVKKSNIKLKTAKTPKVKTVIQPSDATAVVPCMQQASVVMTELSNTTVVNAQQVLLNCSLEKLLELKDYMNNDKTHIDTKLSKMCEYTSQYESLERVSQQVSEAKARLGYLIKESMLNAYETVGDMTMDIDKAINAKMNPTPAPASSSAPVSVVPPAAPTAMDADI